ncbi:MAG: T9SS type A sorting domain-containing protein, partial [Ferruginibacter sp.]
GFNSKNSTTNYVEKSGIPSFSRWTLSSLNNPLPVAFVLFNIKCEGNKVLIHWKTAQEQNSSHYIIERSVDGVNWEMIGNLPAAVNSNTERNYFFTDNNPLQKNYYRIAQYDINDRVLYTDIQRLSCNITDALNIWPNPFHEKVLINISVNHGSQAVIKVFDNKGSLIKIQKAGLLPGSNQLTVDMINLPDGMYQFAIEWDNGQNKKTTKVIKQ